MGETNTEPLSMITSDKPVTCSLYVDEIFSKLGMETVPINSKSLKEDTSFGETG